MFAKVSCRDDPVGCARVVVAQRAEGDRNIHKGIEFEIGNKKC